jgi:hypothetical protein
MKEDSISQRQARIDVAAVNSWEERVGTMSEIISSYLDNSRMLLNKT